MLDGSRVVIKRILLSHLFFGSDTCEENIIITIARLKYLAMVMMFLGFAF